MFHFVLSYQVVFRLPLIRIKDFYNLEVEISQHGKTTILLQLKSYVCSLKSSALYTRLENVQCSDTLMFGEDILILFYKYKLVFQWPPITA